MRLQYLPGSIQYFSSASRPGQRTTSDFMRIAEWRWCGWPPPPSNERAPQIPLKRRFSSGFIAWPVIRGAWESLALRQHTQWDTELALLADPGGAARPDRSGLHPPENRTATAALSRVPLTYIIQLVILAGDDPRLSRQEDAGVRQRTVRQGVPEFRKPSGETAGHPERRAFARYPAVLARKPPRSARGRQDGPVLHSHQSAVATVFRVAGRPGGTGQR